jgi:hypothetical protein
MYVRHRHVTDLLVRLTESDMRYTLCFKIFYLLCILQPRARVLN